MKNICIIPTKKNSTRFKNKNVAPFGKGNLLTNTVEQAIDSSIFNEIILVSDNQGMLDVGRKYGIYTHFMKNTGKQIIDVVRSTIDDLKIDKDSTIGVLLVTCPLRITEDIIKAFYIFKRADSFFPVISVKKNENPIQMSFERTSTGCLTPVMPEDFYRSTRKQDHSDTYYFNDAIIFDLAKRFMNKDRTLYGKYPIPYIMPWERSIAIDYEFQLKMAKGLLEEK